MQSRNIKENNAATKIQKIFRGYAVRKKFHINPLRQSQLTSCSTFVIGNDPIMPSLDRYHCDNDRIALIGNSGLRSVEIAAKLGNKENTPKVIIVDNSKVVHAFWSAFRKFCQSNDVKGSEKAFFEKLPQFLQDNKDIYRHIGDLDLMRLDNHIDYPNQNIELYLKNLFAQYGFDYIINIINSVSLVKQSWANVETFAILKNILRLVGINKIYMYASNIAACVDKRDSDQVLENISKMAPVMSIHTNLCSYHGVPEKVFFFDSQDPNLVKSTLFGSNQATMNLDMDSLLAILYLSEQRNANNRIRKNIISMSNNSSGFFTSNINLAQRDPSTFSGFIKSNMSNGDINLAANKI